MSSESHVPGDRTSEADARLIRAIEEARRAANDDLDMIVSLYRAQRAETTDPLLLFGVTEAKLASDGLSHQRALRALAAAAQRLHDQVGGTP